MSPRVVVVGAGPVGLLLAGELRQRAIDVVLLERLAAPTGQSRASQLNARTMEILHQRGLLTRLGALRSVSHGHFGGIPVPVGGVQSCFPGLWKVGQPRLEAALEEWAVELGVDLRRGYDVRGLQDHGSAVRIEVVGPAGPEVLVAPWVVGCDGVDGVVRAAAGIEMAGQTGTRALLRADVEGVSIRDRRFERTEHGLAIAVRDPDGVTRIMAHEFGSVPDGTTPSFAALAAMWLRITGEDIGNGHATWIDAFDDSSRQAERYRFGRVLLAGDAAHEQMPAGGQALNLGLQDADNLSWKLAATARDEASGSLLDTYHDERHPVGAAVLDNVRAQTIMLLGGPETDAMRTVLAETLAIPSARDEIAATVAGLDVHYDLADPDGHISVGRRLALPAHDGTNVLRALRQGRGVLLDVDTVVPAGALQDWSDCVEHVVLEERPAWLDEDLEAVLVRPDGHVAWVAVVGEIGHGPETALRRWFGPGLRERGTTVGGLANQGKKEIVMGRLSSKSALVTGSSRGIGRAVAERLAAEGALVAVHYASDAQAAGQTVETIHEAGGRAFAFQAELGVPGDVDTLHRRLEAGLREHHGRVALDILVNNAGVMGGVAPDEITSEQFDRLFAINAKAPLFLIQRLLPLIPDGGRIVNISSGLTRFANPDELVYSMTKGALEQIGLHLSRHLGQRDITVNSVAPGVTDNGSAVFDDPDAREYIANLSTFRRIGRPTDVADIVAFVCSPDARWMTGAFVDASGGALLG